MPGSGEVQQATSTDAALIQQAANGSESAVRILVERLTPIVRARVRRRLVGSGVAGFGSYTADDLVQEIWLTLVKDGCKQLRAFDPSRGASLEGFVGMVAERQIGNVRRSELQTSKRRTNTVANDPDTVPEPTAPDVSPEDQALGADFVDRISRHLQAKLSERGQVIFRYLYEDRLEPARIAQIMGVERQVVYNWQHKIRNLVSEFVAAQSSV